MHKFGVVALVGLLALGLTACGDDGAVSSDPGTQARGFANTAESGDAPALTDEQNAFVTGVRENLKATTVIGDASDADLIGWGEAACTAYAERTDVLDLNFFPDEVVDEFGYYSDSVIIGGFASSQLCPDAEINHPENRATPPPEL